MDEIEGEGFSAHGQNEPRTANPYLPKAAAWDEGWANRERQRLIHEVRREEAEHLPAFAAWLAQSAGDQTTHGGGSVEP
jgi:hypothetical protein